MSELPPDAAALLARARDAHGPRQADRDRVLAGLHSALGISAAAAVAATTATAAGATAAAAAEGASIAPAAAGALGWKSALFTWKAGKVMLATVALGGAVGVGSMTLPAREAAHDQRSAEMAKTRRVRPRAEAMANSVDAEEAAGDVANAPQRAPSVQAAAAPSATDAHEPMQTPQREPAVPAPLSDDDAPAIAARHVAPTEVQEASSAARTVRAREADDRGERRARRARRMRRTEGRSAALQAPRETNASATTLDAPRGSEIDAQVAVPREDASRGELALLRGALASVRDGDGAQALSLLADHAARYPGSSFATERRGLRVLALCTAGMTAEGRREQTAFLREAGASPIAARVRSACSERAP